MELAKLERFVRGGSELMNSDVLMAALGYAQRGWPVLPLHGIQGGACTCGNAKCDKPGKHPCIKSGRGHCAATTDPGQIRAWWEKWPNANVGIRTGASSRLVILDVDPRHGGDESLAALVNGSGPPISARVRTGGGGQHFFYAHPGNQVCNAVGIRPGLDIRGDGGLVVAPPSHHVSGARYRWEIPPEEVEPQEMPAWLLALLAQGRGSRGAGAASDEEPIHEGARNDTLYRMACEWRASGDDEEAILTRLRTVPCDPPLADEEIQQIARSAAGHRKGFRPSDYGNARRLVQRHGRDLRYCRVFKAWLFWDESRWKRDTTGEVDRRAADTIIALYGDAALAADNKARSDLIHHALRSEAEPRIRAMVTLAASDSAVAISPEELDSEPWLLNVENGTLDLRTGTLLPHCRDHLITRLAPVAYDKNATSRTFSDFLEKMVPDPDVREFLPRAIGSSLTGCTADEKLFFAHGPTNAGKSSFAEAVKGMLGDYAVTTDFESFLRKRDGGIRNDLARLAGARMVISLEVEEGKHLAVALIKSITGGDTISARFLHKEFFEYLPQFKLWLFANHRPDASAEDAALWRRILVIPFTRSLSEAERDESVKRTLREDPVARAAILAWAVRGCLAWQQHGLAPPAAVLAATGSYRQDCDSIGDFITECCDLDPKTRAWASELYKAYTQWAETNGERPMSQKVFGRRLTERGLGRGRGSAGRHYWVGIRISDPSDPSGPQGDVFSHSAPS